MRRLAMPRRGDSLRPRGHAGGRPPDASPSAGMPSRFFCR